MKSKETKNEKSARLRARRVEDKMSNNSSTKKPNNDMTRMEELYLWENRPFVDNLIDTGASSKSIVDYMRGKGMNMSADTVRRYTSARKAAVTYKGFAELSDFGKNRPDYTKMKRLSKEEKARLQEEYMKRFEGEGALSDKTRTLGSGKDAVERTPSQQLNSLARHRKKQHRNSKQRVMSDLQFLDVMIQKGIETLAQMPSIDPGKALKAIELKHKLTEGKHGGITMYGMEEIRLRENARENAMVEVIQRYVDPDKQEELLQQLEQTTSDFYEAHGLEEAYSASDIEAYLEKENLEPEEDDGYYTQDEAGEK